MKIAATLVLVVMIAGGCSDNGRSSKPGPHLVFTKDVGLSTQSVWIADVDGSHERRLAAGSLAVISPDGRSVAYQGGSGIFRVGSGGGKSHLLADGMTLLAWMPDSQHVLALRGTDLVSLDKNGASTLLDRGADNAFGWSFSPDGRKLVYERLPSGTARCAVPDMYIVDVDGGSRRRLLRAGFPVWGPKGIALSRAVLNCNVLGLWQVRPDSTGLRAIVAQPPARFTTSSFHGLRPYAWIAGEQRLLIGIRTIFGDDAAVLDLTTKRIRKLGTFVDDVSRDGRYVVGTNRGAEFPFSIAIAGIDGGRPRVIARGRVCCADWNR